MHIARHLAPTDLRVAMTLDPTLVTTVQATLPNLDSVDPAALRNVAMPILTGWARAMRLPDANGNLVMVDLMSRDDLASLVSPGTGGHPATPPQV